MSKTISGHFHETIGYNDWNTSIIWEQLDLTQECYEGTELAKSFNIKTSLGDMWVHPNATKHMHEAIISLKSDPRLKDSNPLLYTQFILYDFWKSLDVSIKNGIEYNKIIQIGRWEFIFAKPRKEGLNPVIKHARFVGLS